MAKTITISISDVEEKILYNDILTIIPGKKSFDKDGNEVTGADNEGIKDWHEQASAGKINNAWKRMRTEWTQKLMDDDSFTDSIPSNQADFVNLVTSRPDYKNRKARDDG